MGSQIKEQVLSATDILDRLKRCLKINRDLDLAEKMEVSYRTLQNWKYRDSVSAETVAAFCEKHGLDLTYVLLGREPQVSYVPEVDPYPAGSPFHDINIPLVESESVPLTQIVAITKTHNSQPTCTAHKCKNKSSGCCITPPSRECSILDDNQKPLYTIKSNQIVNHVSLDYAFLTNSLAIQPEHVLIVQVIENNMAPWAMEGDLVIVDTSSTSSTSGGVVVVRYGDEMLVLRRYYPNADGTVTLKSPDGSCPPETITPGPSAFPTIIGRVVRRLVR